MCFIVKIYILVAIDEKSEPSTSQEKSKIPQTSVVPEGRRTTRSSSKNETNNSSNISDPKHDSVFVLENNKELLNLTKETVQEESDIHPKDLPLPSSPESSDEVFSCVKSTTNSKKQTAPSMNVAQKEETKVQPRKGNKNLKTNGNQNELPLKVDAKHKTPPTSPQQTNVIFTPPASRRTRSNSRDLNTSLSVTPVSSPRITRRRNASFTQSEPATSPKSDFALTDVSRVTRSRTRNLSGVDISIHSPSTSTQSPNISGKRRRRVSTTQSEPATSPKVESILADTSIATRTRSRNLSSSESSVLSNTLTTMSPNIGRRRNSSSTQSEPATSPKTESILNSPRVSSSKKGHKKASTPSDGASSPAIKVTRSRIISSPAAALNSPNARRRSRESIIQSQPTLCILPESELELVSPPGTPAARTRLQRSKSTSESDMDIQSLPGSSPPKFDLSPTSKSEAGDSPPSQRKSKRLTQ